MNILLKNMRPFLVDEAFVFLSFTKKFSIEDASNALMIFHEAEGATVLVSEVVAQKMNKNYKEVWAQITLTIHSDLNAIGFLAAIFPKLAEAGIPVNPVSAYFHDHLFVPWEKRHLAMNVLQSF